MKVVVTIYLVHIKMCDIANDQSNCNKLKIFLTQYLCDMHNAVDLWYSKLWILSDPSLKYQRFTPSGCKDIGIGTFYFPL